MSLFQAAKDAFDREVDALAAEYVEQGVNPHTALLRATREVERKRADAYWKRTTPAPERAR